MTRRRVLLIGLCVLAALTCACVDPPQPPEPTPTPDIVIDVPDEEYDTLLAVTRGETQEWGE